MSKRGKSTIIPKGVMHKPSPMVWAQLTPLSEHRELAKHGITIIDGEKMSEKEIIPISRATTELKKVYPYIFDCLAYAQTHNPQKITRDVFFSSFNMPYNVFLDYCLDGCTEQTQSLKEEIYKMWGKKDEKDKDLPDTSGIKYIKVNGTEILGRPIDISLIRSDLLTKKEERILNIGQDKKVEYIHIHVLNGLLDTSHGYGNHPKAFYAKVRRIYNILKQNGKIFENANAFRKLIANADQFTSFHITVAQANEIVELYKDRNLMLDELEQGGFHAVFLAFEYILINKKRGLKKQGYSLLKLCEKCKPELVQIHNGILYFKDKKKVSIFFALLAMFAVLLQNEKAIGIKDIIVGTADKNDIPFTVCFE
jgi:hypothetical protein